MHYLRAKCVKVLLQKSAYCCRMDVTATDAALHHRDVCCVRLGFLRTGVGEEYDLFQVLPNFVTWVIADEPSCRHV